MDQSKRKLLQIELLFISSSAGREAGAKSEDIMHTHMDFIMMVNRMIVMEMIMRPTIVPHVAQQHNHHAIDRYMVNRHLQGPITLNWTNVIH